uniref:Uncharacterized protein n=1 Tax=Cacopsylla melanoneura TaxID=428564 RepID=A0A8D9F8H2_9HEMI
MAAFTHSARYSVSLSLIMLIVLLLVQADRGYADPNQTESTSSSSVPPSSLSSLPSSVPIYLTTALADITINIHTSPVTLDSTEDDQMPFRNLSVETSTQGPDQDKTGSRETNATTEKGLVSGI